MIGTDEKWQELIKKYGVNNTGEMLMFFLNLTSEERDSLLQPSPYKTVPTITTDSTTPPENLKGV